MTVISRAYFMFQVFTVKDVSRDFMLFLSHHLSLGKGGKGITHHSRR